jgi:hypothetical protein
MPVACRARSCSASHGQVPGAALLDGPIGVQARAGGVGRCRVPEPKGQQERQPRVFQGLPHQRPPSVVDGTPLTGAA